MSNNEEFEYRHKLALVLWFGVPLLAVALEVLA